MTNDSAAGWQANRHAKHSRRILNRAIDNGDGAVAYVFVAQFDDYTMPTRRLVDFAFLWSPVLRLCLESLYPKMY